jgi:DNA (cytosine-5)-methyltransferase 1
MRIGSCFSGIEGFCVNSFLKGKDEIIWQIENDKYCNYVLNYQFPDVKKYSDITEVNGDSLNYADVIVGGFPCQSFSIAGNMEGFQDGRGILFFEIMRIIREVRPRYFVLENVKNLLGHDGRETIKQVFNTISESGYLFEWSLFNSKDFGVPQSRERVYIIGYNRGESRPEIFLRRETNETPIIQVGHLGNDLMANRIYSTKGSGVSLRANAGGLGAKTGLIVVQNNEVIFKDKIYNIDANYYKGIDNHQQRTGVITDQGIRRLTPLECERSQGFPDKYTKIGLTEEGKCVKISDQQRYKMIGNAVTTNVAEWILDRIREVI